MKKYSALVLSVVESINKNYEEARSDLVRVVAEVEHGMKDVLPDFKMRLTLLDDDAEGTFYRVEAVPAPDDSIVGIIRITDFFIPANGYPISSGRILMSKANFNPQEKFDSVENLENFFQNLLADPESRLIQAIGFAMRRKTAQFDSDTQF
jgi:hypothetical protein